MKHFNLAIVALCAIWVCSCSGTRVEGTVPDAAGKQLVVKVLGVGCYDKTDTVRVDASGKFSFSLDVEENQPQFVYVTYKERNIASLLLSRGEKVSIKTDTLGGSCTAKGSPETEKLLEQEKAYAEFLRDIRGSKSSGEFVSKYVAWYRKCVAYVVKNNKSLTSIPVLHEKVNDYSPVFAQTTDAIHFRSLCDSLKQVYPDSKYVKALEKETKTRENELALDNAIKNAPRRGFPDIEMPSSTGKTVKLSEVKARVILLHFWNSADPLQKMMNLEVLKPIYADYAKRGFEIFAVDVNPDKVTWGNSVNSQNTGWINVNDGRGSASPALRTYNISTLPTSIIISNGNIITNQISGEAGLRKELARLLK